MYNEGGINLTSCTITTINEKNILNNRGSLFKPKFLNRRKASNVSQSMGNNICFTINMASNNRQRTQNVFAVTNNTTYLREVILQASQGGNEGRAICFQCEIVPAMM